jgi:hypothetical protein
VSQRSFAWSKLPSRLFAAFVIALLLWGWSERNEYWYTADHGLGYEFGIVGLSLMGLLLLYPLRKHWKPLKKALPIRYWFRMHMVFGILGPVFILFHANFHGGSINSIVALCSMLLVAGSGLIGRFVYRQIHRGLYGEAIRYSDLMKEFERTRPNDAFIADKQIGKIRARLDSNASSMIMLAFGMFILKRRIRRETSPANVRALVMLARMARLRTFSKLFSFWHVFHLPIFFMMLITAAVHIVVVHMY